MTRIALLPAGGDPFVIAYWLRHYDQVWRSEVDTLYLHVVGQSDPKVIDYLARVAPSNVVVTSQGGREPHGTVLRRMVDEFTKPGDLVLFCEDDAFVRHPGVIDSRFCAIENGEVDVIGTARGNATPNLIARAEELYGPSPVTATGETGLSLYPCFLFAHHDNLLHLDFESQAWKAGDYIPALDYRCKGEEACDTFTLASWWLRWSNDECPPLAIRAEAAYRSDSAHSGAGRRNVDGGTNTGDAPWFHVGSLSSGYGCAFMVPKDGTYRQLCENVARPTELYDWHKRMAWWTRVLDCWDGGIPNIRDEYAASLYEFMRDVRADWVEVERWRAAYDPLVTWAER